MVHYVTNTDKYCSVSSWVIGQFITIC